MTAVDEPELKKAARDFQKEKMQQQAAFEKKAAQWVDLEESYQVQKFLIC